MKASIVIGIWIASLAVLVLLDQFDTATGKNLISAIKAVLFTLHLYLMFVFVLVGMKVIVPKIPCPACKCLLVEKEGKWPSFCPGCGIRLDKHRRRPAGKLDDTILIDTGEVCPLCGRETEPGDAYCAECGGNLGLARRSVRTFVERSGQARLEKKGSCLGCGAELNERFADHCPACGIDLSLGARLLEKPPERKAGDGGPSAPDA